MVLTEEFAQVVPVRPGRRLFVRKITIGQQQQQQQRRPLLLLSPPDAKTVETAPPPAAALAAATWQLVCLHGTCASERQFQPLLKSMDTILSEQKQQTLVSCLLFDNVGCGQSPSLPNWNAYENSEISADLQAVVEQYCDPTLPIVCMGHSYAPSILLPSILDRPDLFGQLSGCILLSTAVRSPHLPMPDGGHAIMKLPVILLKCFQRQLTESFLQMAVHKNHVSLRDALRVDCNRNDMRVAQAYHGHHCWARVEQLQQALVAQHAVVVPTLVVHGADDGVIPVQCGQHLARQLLPHSTFVVMEEASHMVMLEQPEQTARHVMAFLQKLAKLSPN
jgi:pimeloyl-ACP methyl ester carboxylesterase